MPTKLPTFEFLWAKRGQNTHLFVLSNDATAIHYCNPRTRLAMAAALRAC
nr:MAG TPA: hypothetical protein [Caudoviricetes sp.]